MRRRQILSCLFLLLLATSLPGCGRRTAAPAGLVDPPHSRSSLPDPADPTQRGALAALGQYAAARRALDLPGAYSLLCPSAQAAFTAEEFGRVFVGQKAYTYVGVEVETPRDGLVRGYVLGLTVTGMTRFQYARYPYTLRYENGRWGVAHARALGPAALRAFESGRWDESLSVADRWLSIDPYAWEAYLERFYVFKDTGQAERAREAWESALRYAPAEEHPELYDILAMLYLYTREAEPLKAAALWALEAARALGAEQSERYGARWRAGVVVDLAHAAMLRGDHRAAFKHLQEARELDPANMDVDRFLRTMPAR